VDEVAACGAVEAGARAKIRQVERKISELRRIRDALDRLVAACEAREPDQRVPHPGGAGGGLPALKVR
jgi:hypothetical protein